MDLTEMMEFGKIQKINNEIYYKVRGETVVEEDFKTLAAHDDKTAKANGIDVLEIVNREDFDKLIVVEIGIGNGQFARDFLETVVGKIDLKYYLFDVSEKMIDDVKKRDWVSNFEGVLEFGIRDAEDFDLGFLKNTDEKTLIYFRFNELYDDLSCEYFLKDGEDVYKLFGKMTIDDSEEKKDEIKAAVDAMDIEGLKKIGIEVTEKIRLEFEPRKIDLNELCVVRRELISESPDMSLIPVNVGCALNFKKIVTEMNDTGKKFMIDIFDYGLPVNEEEFIEDMDDPSRLYSQDFSGCRTNDVNFRFLWKITEKNWDGKIGQEFESQREYIEKVFGIKLYKVDDIFDVDGNFRLIEGIKFYLKDESKYDELNEKFLEILDPSNLFYEELTEEKAEKIWKLLRENGVEDGTFETLFDQGNDEFWHYRVANF